MALSESGDVTVPGEAQQRAERAKMWLADFGDVTSYETENQLARDVLALVASTDDAVARSYLERALAAEARVEAAEKDRNVVAEGLDMWRSRALVAEKRLAVAGVPVAEEET